MASKPRIAYILQMFGIGGMPKWLYNLARCLQDEFEFYFVATHSDYVVPQYREVARVATLPFRRRILQAYLMWHRIDLVQMANLRLYADAALAARVPVVMERTDGLRSGAALNPKHGLDAVIASTQGTVPAIARLIDRSRIHVIYNGVDIDHFAHARPQRYGFAPHDIVIGRTTRLAGGKNISLLIRAVIEIRQNPAYQHVRLVICGGNTTQRGAVPMLAELKREAAPLGDSVVFTGEVFDPAPIVRGYDIATCTSRPNNEGIPNSLIEAMAAGKPVVATAVDDIPELVADGHNGLLVPSDDLHELVKALKTLIDDESLRQRLGTAGQGRVRRDFCLEKQVAKYAALYHRLIQEKGRRSSSWLW